jgi:hypothetical protein
MAESLPILLLILAAFALAFAALARRWPFQTLATVLMLLLVHELLLRWAANLLDAPPLAVTGLSLWKDGALLGMGAAGLWQAWASRRRRPAASPPFLRRYAVELAFAAAVLVGLLRLLGSSNRLAAVFAFRDYYEPVLVLFLARAFLPTRQQLRRLLTWWLAALAVLALLGTWQTLFWSAEDYVRWGFGPAISDLGVPPLELGGRLILRGPSTLSGPNELGMQLVLGMLALAWLAYSATRRQRWAIAGLGAWLGVALAISYSRGDILAFPIGLAVIYLARQRRPEPHAAPAVAVHAAILVALALATARSGLWGFMQDTAENLDQDYHVQDSAEALEYLAEHPGGVDLGTVGPRIGAFFPAPEDVAFHIEGSVFQIAFELGIPGLIAWGLFLGLALWQAWAASRVAATVELQLVAATAVAGWIGSGVVFLFIPLMQSLTMMAWMWFLLGLTLSTVEVEERWKSESRSQPAPPNRA